MDRAKTIVHIISLCETEETKKVELTKELDELCDADLISAEICAMEKTGKYEGYDEAKMIHNLQLLYLTAVGAAIKNDYQKK